MGEDEEPGTSGKREEKRKELILPRDLGYLRIPVVQITHN
jgi:hypothetical protein